MALLCIVGPALGYSSELHGEGKSHVQAPLSGAWLK